MEALIGSSHGFFDHGLDSDSEFLVYMGYDSVNCFSLHHFVVAAKPLHYLNIGNIPQNIVFGIHDEIFQHSLEVLLVLIADCDAVILVEHHAQHPIPPGGGAVARLGFVDTERSVEACQDRLDHGFNFPEVERVFGGDV